MRLSSSTLLRVVLLPGLLALGCVSEDGPTELLPKIAVEGGPVQEAELLLFLQPDGFLDQMFALEMLPRLEELAARQNFVIREFDIRNSPGRLLAGPAIGSRIKSKRALRQRVCRIPLRQPAGERLLGFGVIGTRGQIRPLVGIDAMVVKFFRSVGVVDVTIPLAADRVIAPAARGERRLISGRRRTFQ